MLPAHGPIIDDPVRVLREYIAHRLEREEQVVAALRAGKQTPDAIVAQVYETSRSHSFLLHRRA